MAQSMHDVSDPRNASILINVDGELKPRAEAVVSVADRCRPYYERLAGYRLSP